MQTAPIDPPDTAVLAPLGPGWLAIPSPVPLELGGTFQVVRIATGGGMLLVLCQATVPGTLPGRSARLRVRGRIEERVGEVVVLFLDAVRTTAVWSLPPGPCAGVPAEYHLPGRESEVAAALRALLATRAGARLPALEESILATLIAARLPGCPPGAVTISELTRWVHRHAPPERARRCWHPLTRLTLLDPACAAGEWLEAAGSTLLPLLTSTLHRARADLDDRADRDSPGRDVLHGLRPLLADLRACGGDVELVARRTLCRRTLHGIADSAAEARAARARLADFGRLPARARTPLDVRVKVSRRGAANAARPEPEMEREGWVLGRARALLDPYRASAPAPDVAFRRSALTLERRERRWAAGSAQPWADRAGAFDFERPG